jgi:acetoacetyl-CoA synthetase
MEIKRKLLWNPDEKTVENSNMFKFMNYVNNKYNVNIKNYEDLWKWSVNEYEKFWESVWDFTNVIYTKKFDKVVDDINKFPGAKWFTNSKLNYAKNLLRKNDDSTSIIFESEPDFLIHEIITWKQLNEKVSILQQFIDENIDIYGKSIAAYMPHIPETVYSLLASTSLGGIWSSMGTELGPTVIIDRLEQIRPEILFTVDSYRYKGKVYKMEENINKILEKIESIKMIILFHNRSDEYIKNKRMVYFEDISKDYYPKKLIFKDVDGNHPLFIMFSSGTTGKPKSMVQPTAGVLLNHLKELIIHSDLREDDIVTYITSPSWMMWNWITSSLAVGSKYLIFDGNPLYPDWKTMFDIAERNKLTFLGVSATYINTLRTLNANPSEYFRLDSLREISQTGSPLSPEGFEYIYEKIKKNIHFNSISGGTDINGCFGIGSPILPVYSGQVQSKGLGMKIACYDQNGNPILDSVGELVCEMPSPSMPLYFLHDENNNRYFETYFSYYYPKKIVWRHGDFVIFDSVTNGIIFLGRSDSTLKPSGVRIGTAEIYRILEGINEIEDSVVVGIDIPGDQKIALFVKLRNDYKLDENLEKKIKEKLRKEGSPRHVPDIIVEVPEIPYTFNQKKVEIIVSNIMNNRPITNLDTIINRDCVEFYKKIAPEIRKRLNLN